jgi:hypothetical protein
MRPELHHAEPLGDHAGLLKAHQEEAIRLFSDEDSPLTGDGCDFPKKKAR